MSAVPVAPDLLDDARVVKWSDGRLLTVIEDDWVVDPVTGELVGHLTELTPPAETFEPDHDWCEDIVRRRANAVANITGLEAQMKMLIDGIRERFQPKINREQNKLKWLDGPSGPMKLVIAYARAKVMERKKGKSFDFDFGRIPFTKSGGKLEIVDEEKAAQFALANAPKAVKVAIDLDGVPEEVMPEAVKLITFLQSLAPGSITLSTRKSFIDVTEEISLKVPELDPSTVDGENMPESGFVITPTDEFKPGEVKH